MSGLADDLCEPVSAWEEENIRLRQEVETLKSEARHWRAVMEDVLRRAEKLGEEGAAAYTRFCEDMRELLRRHS